MHESEKQVIFPSLSYAFLLLFLAVIFQMVGGVFMAILYVVLGLPIKPEEPAFVGTINLLAFGFLLWLGNYLTGRSAKKTYPFTSFKPGLVVPIIVTVVGMILVSSEMDNALRSVLPMPDFLANIMQELVGTGLSSFIVLAVVAPFTEELLFRGLLLQGFLSRYSPTKSIIWTAFLFALLHLNPYQFFPTLAVGLFLGWLFYRTRSLWPCILVHALGNSLIFVSQYLPFAIKGFNTGLVGKVQFQPWWLDGLGVLCVCAGIWGLTLLFPDSQPDHVDDGASTPPLD